MKQKSWVPAYIALGTVWCCSFIFIKQGLEFLTPFGVAFGRCAFGALSLVIVLKFRKQNFPREKSTWAKLWVVSLLLNVFPGILFAYAEVHVTSILAGIINATTPLMTLIVLLTVFREEKIHRYQFVGLLIGAIGVRSGNLEWHRRKFGFGRTRFTRGGYLLRILFSFYPSICASTWTSSRCDGHNSNNCSRNYFAATLSF